MGVQIPGCQKDLEGTHGLLNQNQSYKAMGHPKPALGRAVFVAARIRPFPTPRANPLVGDPRLRTRAKKMPALRASGQSVVWRGISRLRINGLRFLRLLGWGA